MQKKLINFKINYELKNNVSGITLGIIIMSDKGYANEREDKCAPIIQDLITKTLTLSSIKSYILPDKPRYLQTLLLNLAILEQTDLIIISGGTGIAPTDKTPEALLPLIDTRLYGFEQAMLIKAMQKTPNAIISRAVCGTIDNTLIISLPGSPKAVEENLEVLLPAIEHTIKKLQGDKTDCIK